MAAVLLSLLSCLVTAAQLRKKPADLLVLFFFCHAPLPKLTLDYQIGSFLFIFSFLFFNLFTEVCLSAGFSICTWWEAVIWLSGNVHQWVKDKDVILSESSTPTLLSPSILNSLSVYGYIPKTLWRGCFVAQDRKQGLIHDLLVARYLPPSVCLHLCALQVLTFKEINWQSLRIEADAIESEDQDLGSTPLRLITNQGRIRIALKRRVTVSPASVHCQPHSLMTT